MPDTYGFAEDIHDLSDVVVDDRVRLTETEDDGVAKNPTLITLLDKIYTDAVVEVYGAEVEMTSQRN